VFGLAAGAPGSNFDTLGGATQVGIAGDTYAGLVAADQAVATGGGILSGWALSPQARGLLLGATDTTNRPLFTGGVADGNVPTLLGAPTAITKGVYSADIDGAGAGTAARLGFAGDWSSAHYGIVENIELSISSEATINDGGTQLNLWQRNMFAVRVEFEVGFRVRDIAHFAQLTNATQA
jgi:HK97 family phage major capsid protein